MSNSSRTLRRIFLIRELSSTSRFRLPAEPREAIINRPSLLTVPFSRFDTLTPTIGVPPILFNQLKAAECEGYHLYIFYFLQYLCRVSYVNKRRYSNFIAIRLF